MRSFALVTLLLLAGCDDVNNGVCDNDGVAADAHIAAAVEAELACAVAEDCVAVDISTGCQGACPVFVKADGAGRVTDAIVEADDLFCQDVGGDCAFAMPGCLAPVPACVDGACTFGDPWT